jgi:hypothetical protein
MRGKYLTKRRLRELEQILPERDKMVLRSLLKCQYLTSRQIGRLHFYGYANKSAIIRTTNRALAKLRDYGLAEPLYPRVGSKVNNWAITESGMSLINLDNPGYKPPKSYFEASHNFLKHTIEVAEVYVQLFEVCQKHQMELVKTEMEPECWRGHVGEDGKRATMKPDMFARTGNADFEDSWFIEVDMDTESPNKVVEKCRRYSHYYKCGHEQKQNEVFPVVVWIAYNLNRKNKLQQYIDECLELWPKNIFLVIMPDEFEELIVNGAEALLKKRKETNEI